MHDICPRCGTEVTPSRPSRRELVVTAMCGSILFSILVPACWMTEQWIERQGQRILNRAVWHEPLENWSQ